jgi:hypothetical protein
MPDEWNDFYDKLVLWLKENSRDTTICLGYAENKIHINKIVVERPEATVTINITKKYDDDADEFRGKDIYEFDDLHTNDWGLP